MTLVPGSLAASGDWGENASMASAIEQALVTAGVLDPSSETPDATAQRRKSFIALATGIIDHMKLNLTLTFNAGDLKSNSESGTQVPAAQKTLTGKAS